MKRAKSTLSLRNLAHSIQQSICMQKKNTQPILLQARQTPSKSLLALQPSRSSVNLVQEKIEQEERVENKMYILQKKIVGMEKQLQATSGTVRNYTAQLDQYQKISKEIVQKQKQLANANQQYLQLRNQLQMMQQDSLSAAFNAQQRIAEKQYYQQIITTYQQQYKAQSQQLIGILELQQQIKQTQISIKQIQQQILQAKMQYNEWKKDSQFSLKQHKLKHNLKLIRMKLIECQDQCDSFCNQHSLRKLRQIYCLFFKQYAKSNGVAHQEAEQGIDLFICRHRLCEQFSQFVRQRLVYNKPACGPLETYLVLLSQMETVFARDSCNDHKKLNYFFNEQLKELQSQKNKGQSKIKQCQLKIKNHRENIDSLFGNDSIAQIQCMREQNNNKYDIKQIKNKLKANKKQLDARIKSITHAYQQTKYLESNKKIQNHQRDMSTKQSLQEMSEKMVESQLFLQKIQQQRSKLKQKKQKIQEFINQAVSKWNQRDQLKAQLKITYKQLQSLKFKKSRFSKYSQDEMIDPPIALKAQGSNKKLQKQSSKSSIFQSKSSLSIGNPFQRILDKEAEENPVITDCKMVFSKQIISRPLQTYNFHKNKEKSEKQHDSVMSITKKTKKSSKQKKQRFGKQSKQNLINAYRNKSQALCKSKYSLSLKPVNNACSKTTKGTMSQSQRISLSNMLLSKFNR